MNDDKKIKLLELIKKAHKAGKLDSALWNKIVKTLNKSSRKDTFNTVVNMDLTEMNEILERSGGDNKKILASITDLLQETKDGQKTSKILAESLVKESEKHTEAVDLMRDDLVDLNKVAKQSAKTTHIKLDKVVKAQTDGTSSVLQALSVLFSGLITTITTVAKRGIFKVQPTPEAFLTPQYVVLYDPHKKSAANLKALGGTSSSGRFSVNAPSEINLKNGLGAVINPATEETLQDVLTALGGASSTTAGDGTRTVTTAGTRVQLSATSVPCRRVVIQAHEENTGTIVIGGVTCVAALSGRRGTAIFPTQSQAFEVTDLNALYIDSTVDGDKVNYYYEVSA